MPDWSDDLRARLADLRLSPAREVEIVEELSQHLDDRYEELRAAGSSDADARRLAIEELNEAGGLASGCTRCRRRPRHRRSSTVSRAEACCAASGRTCVMP